MTAVDGDLGRFAERAERLGKAPDFDLRRNAHLLTQCDELAVALGRLGQIEACDVRGADRRRGQSAAADRGHQLHVPPRFLECLGATGIVVDDPLEEADHVLDGQSDIRNALSQIRKRAALLHVFVKLANPWLDGLIAGAGHDIDLLRQTQVLAANRAGVEAKAERFHVGGFLGLGRPLGGKCRRHRGGDRKAGLREHGTAFQNAIHSSSYRR